MDPESDMRRDNGSNGGTPRRSGWLVHKVLCGVRVRPEARMGSVSGQEKGRPSMSPGEITHSGSKVLL